MTYYMYYVNYTLDTHLTMNAHVSNIAYKCYFETRRLASIRIFLTSTVTVTLVSATLNLVVWHLFVDS